MIAKSIRFLMKDMPYYFVKNPELRIGGLVVCGLNWAEKEARDENPDWQTNTFLLDEGNNPCKDKLREHIKKCFDRWGHPISANSPLDKAILPTNLFYNNTPSCSKQTFNTREWDKAVGRLFLDATQYRLLGYLICGFSACDAVWRFLKNIDRNFFWNEESEARGVYIGKAGIYNVAITQHYASRGMNEKYIDSISQDMQAWLDEATINL